MFTAQSLACPPHVPVDRTIFFDPLAFQYIPRLKLGPGPIYSMKETRSLNMREKPLKFLTLFQQYLLIFLSLRETQTRTILATITDKHRDIGQEGGKRSNRIWIISVNPKVIQNRTPKCNERTQR